MNEMIELESQPFSVVDDPGFTRLVHQIESQYSLPSKQICDGTDFTSIIVKLRLQNKTMEKHHNDKGVRTKKSEMLTSLKNKVFRHGEERMPRD